MQPTPGVFTGKLCELERQYGDAVDRLRLYQQADHEQVRRELQALWQDCRERELQMRESVRESRSPAVAALSAIDLQMSCDETNQSQSPNETEESV